MDILRERELLLSTERDLDANFTNAAFAVPYQFRPGHPANEETIWHVGDLVSVIGLKEPRYISSWGLSSERGGTYVTLTEEYGRFGVWKLREYKPITFKKQIHDLRNNLQCVNLLYVGNFVWRTSWELIKSIVSFFILLVSVWLLVTSQDNHWVILTSLLLIFLGIWIIAGLPKSMKDLYQRFKYTSPHPEYYDEDEEEEYVD